MDPTQILVAVIAAVAAFAGGFLVRRTQTSTVDINELITQVAAARHDAEMARSETATLRAEIQFLTSEVKRLTVLEERMADGIDERDQRIADLEEEVAELKAEVHRWRDWVRAQGYDVEQLAEQLADATAFDEEE